MNIKIHTMYFLPEFGSAPILMNDLAVYLSKSGHNVQIITTTPRNFGNLVPKRQFYSTERREGFYIKRFWANATASPFGRFIAWSIYAIWSSLNLIMVRKDDILFLRLPPLQLGVVGILAKRIKKAKVVLNIQDIHPDLAVESGILKNGLLIKIAKAIERFSYKESDLIIVISEGFKNNLLNKGVDFKKICVIPNWVDVDSLKPLAKDNYLSSRMLLKDKFVVMHAGTLSLSNFKALENLLKAAKLLESEKDLIFVIVGDGIKKKELEKKTKDLNLINVRFMPFFPQEDLPYLLASSDILIVPLDSNKSELSVPSKLYSFMAAGRAILCLAGRNSELSGFISRNECGYFADAEDIQGIKNAIEILKSDIPYRKKLMENSRNYVLEHFSRDKILNIYEEEISKL